MKSIQAISLLVVALIGLTQGQNTVRGGDRRAADEVRSLEAASIFEAALDVVVTDVAASDPPSDVPSDVPSDSPSYVPTAL